MAIRWAVASGNWSSTATWNGGTLPAVDDDVFADGFNVAVNQSITVLSLSTRQRSGGTNGGSFSVTASGIVINATTLNAGSSPVVWASGGSVGLTVNATTINSGLTAGATSYGVSNTSSGGTVTVNAVTINGGTSVSGSANGVRVTGGTTIINCTQAIGGTGGFANAIVQMSSANLTINGNVVGGGNSTSAGLSINGSSGTVVLNGNATGGSASGAFGVVHNSTTAFTLNGTAIASDACEAVSNASTAVFTVTAARHASNGHSPWTGNGRILFANLDLAHVTVNNAANVQRMLGRRMLAPLGSFEGGFNA